MLDISRNFFGHLNKIGVRYCHWKSNEHLSEALSGKTDLDILVSFDDKEPFEEALAEFPFKMILSPPEKQFPGMSDYLGFDEKTGEFVHLHVHHFLVLGQKYIKNHHLPLESLFFDNLILKDGIYIPCPELELLLLIIRANVKVDIVSLLKHAIKDFSAARYTAYPTDIENELSALIARADMEKFDSLLIQSELPLENHFLKEFIRVFSCAEFKFYHIIQAQMKILAALKPYRRNKSILVYLEYAGFFVSQLKIMRFFKPYQRKKLVGAGSAFAIVGADGSGKSTLIEDLNKWLSWKLEVKQYYFGIPKNRITKLNRYAQRLLRKLGFLSAIDYLDARFWLYVARYRSTCAIKMKNDISNGRAVITDRFPLKAFDAMDEPMDGPRIRSNKKYAGSDWVQQEEHFYNSIELPDRIFVLQVDIDELRKRKTDLDLAAHKLKAQAVNALEASDIVVLINANKPYDQVKLEIQQLIWNQL